MKRLLSLKNEDRERLVRWLCTVMSMERQNQGLDADAWQRRSGQTLGIKMETSQETIYKRFVDEMKYVDDVTQIVLCHKQSHPLRIPKRDRDNRQ